ncbi:cytochrome b5 [Papiliotrema laurentii]|uniref:Cytochrome b5 n=1 Tax=Papiliotrema laurentii TaxID=5418 RepID=A0AAD9FSG8_PAPLA|nr:cytochrome b5 [Papiliotrema laurentii]
MSLSNPLNTLLIPPILYLLYLVLFPAHPQSPTKLPTEYSPDEYNWLPAQHPPVTCYKRFGPRELSKYDGKGQGPEGQRILLAIMRIGRDGKVPQAGKIQRTVFDVSNGRNFYGPDGMYGNFAGRDASRGMAKQSFDEEMLTDIDKPLDSLTDLTSAEVENMRGWHEHFERKYTVCGELVEESEADA